MPMMALVPPVYDCLFRLAQSDALKNEEEVNLEHYYWGLTEMDQLNTTQDIQMKLQKKKF